MCKIDKTLDKFALRYGAIVGRCNAKRKKHPGKLCKRYPLKGSKRCRRHGIGWNTGARELQREWLRTHPPKRTPS